MSDVVLCPLSAVLEATPPSSGTGTGGAAPDPELFRVRRERARTENEKRRIARYRAKRCDRFAVFLAVSLICITLVRILAVKIYLTADAGHYLADADALFGHGVRDSRHLPGFPLLIGLIHLVVPYWAAVAGAAIVLTVLLYLGFYLAIRKEFNSSIGEPLGALVFAASTTVGEALGWYGGAMLLGLAVLPVTIRAVDDAIAERSVRRTVIAAALTGFASLTHPLPFTFVGIGCVVVTLRHVITALLNRDRSTVRGIVSVSTGIVFITGVTLLTVRGFYSALQSPVELKFSPQQLGLVWSWAFRENPVFWVSLAAIGAVGPLIRRRGAVDRPGRSFSLSFSVIAIFGLTNVVLFSGDQSYTTRYLYFLPLLCGIGVTWLISQLEQPGRKNWIASTVATMAVIMLIFVIAVLSYNERLKAAIGYYNTTTIDEISAIEKLSTMGRDTVIVTAKGADRSAGTLYGWIVEGVARRKAVGPGEPYIFLLQKARDDSLNAERVLAGSEVLEGRGIRLGLEISTDTLTLAVEENLDWVPTWSIWFPYRAGDISGERRVDSNSGSISAGPNDVYDVRVLADGANSVIRIEWDASRTGLHLIPSRVLPLVDPARKRFGKFGQATSHGTIATAITTGWDLLEVNEAPDRTWSITSGVVDGRQRVDLMISRPSTSPEPGPSKTGFKAYEASVLADQLGVSDILTWRGSAEDNQLANRRCWSNKFENRSMRIYHVDRRCTVDG